MMVKQTHVTGCTELSLTVFDLWAELLQQSFLHSPDGRGLPAGLQSHLGSQEIQVCYFKVNFSFTKKTNRTESAEELPLESGCLLFGPQIHPVHERFLPLRSRCPPPHSPLRWQHPPASWPGGAKSGAERPGPPLESEETGAERRMRRGTKKQMRTGKAARCQVPGPDRRRTGEAWWTEEGQSGSGEGWTGARTGWLAERWTEEGRCQPSPCVCTTTAEAEAQRTGTPDSLCPHSVGPEEGRVQRDLREEGGRARRGTWRGRGMMVQEQELVQMEDLENKEDEIQQVDPEKVLLSESSRVRLLYFSV